MEGLSIDWVALWNAGGFGAVMVVCGGVALIIFAARFDRRTSEKSDPVNARLDDLISKVDALTLTMERRVTVTETRLDDHQRQLDRLDRREK